MVLSATDHTSAVTTLIKSPRAISFQLCISGLYRVGKKTKYFILFVCCSTSIYLQVKNKAIAAINLCIAMKESNGINL